MTCWSGYYHGVIERAFAGVPRSKVASIARSLCTGKEITKTYFLLYQCVHGLGHGLMIYSGDDLPWSLGTCHKLQTGFDRVSCTGGVFMQNLDTTMGVSKYLKEKNPADVSEIAEVLRFRFQVGPAKIRGILVLADQRSFLIGPEGLAKFLHGIRR